MKERFAGRLVTLKPDFSVSYNMSTEQARRLRSEVYAAGTSMNLIFLDCDASCPEDLQPANIHAHIVYIQIARQKVLHKLIKEMTAKSRERDEQLHQAYHLYENSVSRVEFRGGCTSCVIVRHVSLYVITQSIPVFSPICFKFKCLQRADPLIFK